MRSLRFGSGAAAFVAGAALVLAATPAQAEPAGADVEFKVAGNQIVRMASKPFYVHIVNHGPATAENVVVKVDVSGLDTAKVEVEAPIGCDVDGTIYTCLVGNLVDGENDNGFSPLTIKSLSIERETAGSFAVEVTSDTSDPNPGNNKQITVPVEVVKRGFDLVALVQDVWAVPVADEDGNKQPVAPGATAPLVFSLANHGKATANGITWTITLPAFVTFPANENRRGCVYNAERTEATCERPGARLHPGGTFTLARPMNVKVAVDAPGPVALSGGVVDGGSVSQSAPVTEQVAAAATRQDSDDVIVATDPGINTDDPPTESVPSDNSAAFAVHTATNKADLSVSGGSASGSVGATVTIAVTVKNGGPASSPFSTVKVTAPTGTELVDLPTGCEFETAGKVAKCSGLLSAGEENTGTFSFKIVSGSPGSDGRAEVSGTLDDDNPDNNSDALTITVGGSGGGLPITGTKVTVIGGTGAAALVAGIALFLAARRRRVVLVTPGRDA